MSAGTIANNVIAAQSVSNPYLAARLAEYERVRATVAGVQENARLANRSMTDEERASVNAQGVIMAGLATEIQDLSAIEARNAAVAGLDQQIRSAQGTPVALPGVPANGIPADGGDHTRRPVGGAVSNMRDPGHYRSIPTGGHRSFFGDMVQSAGGNPDAARRIGENQHFQLAELRALDMPTEGVGLLPPKWMTELYAAEVRQGRAMANAVRRIDLGNDPRPMTLPKQTGATDLNVQEQAAENDPIDTTDRFDTDVDTVTPKAISGGQIFSRQMLDMATPAVDQLIFTDLREAYDDKIERRVCLTIEQAGPAYLTAAAGSDPSAPTHYNRRSVRALVAVRKARKRPAGVWGMSVARWGELIGLTDTTGRPLIPEGTAGPTNVSGIGSVATDGRWHAVPIVATDGFLDDGMVFAIYTPDIILFESGIMQFSYDQVSGPQSIKIGIWAYAATFALRKPKPVQGLSITGDGESA